MKIYYLFILLLLAGADISLAQDNGLKPTVDKAIYFDVSPPLRDMIQLQPGPVDQSWKNGTVKVIRNEFDLDRDPYRSDQNGNILDPGLQDYLGGMLTDTTIVNFDGLGNGGGVPPDTYGEAGPNEYFQVVNLSYAIYNKSGARIFGPFPSSSVWSGMPNNTNSGDAVVLYDETANRWLFTQFSLPNYPSGPFYQMIAVSQTPDPTGSWYRYQYEFASMPDYPKFGVWPDGYYMSANLFVSGSGWVGNGAYGYDRTAMLAGNPNAVRISFTIPAGSAGFITLYPSDCDGPFPPAGTPNYFGFIKTNGSQYFGIYEFHANFSNPGSSTFGNLASLTVNPFGTMQGGIPQLGSSAKLETISDRLMYRLQYRKFSDHDAMVVNHTVNAGSGVAGIRWYELRKTSGPWSIYQQSTYAPADNQSRWMGSIAMDTAGSIALGYSVSSSTMYPAIRYTGRLKTDPLNQMTIAEKTMINGGGSQTGVWSGRSRWGDYSGMSIDPSNPTTFWYTTEYYQTTSSSSWSTRIASFTFDDVFSTSASSTPQKICLGDSSRLNVIAIGGSSSYTYSWTSIPAGFTSNVKNPFVFPTDTTKYVVATSDGTLTRHDTTEVRVVFPPEAFAGNDTTICSWLSSVNLEGTASNYRMVGWATLGDGTFSHMYTLTTTYNLGPEDKSSGSVELKLVAFAISPCHGNVISTKFIYIDACTGVVNPSADELSMTIGSNPAHGHVSLSISGLYQKTAHLSITGVDGRTLFVGTIEPGEKKITKQIDLSGFPKGLCIVQLKTDTKVLTEKMVVQ